MGTNDAIQDLNPNEIDYTKVPSLPSWLENEYQYSFMYKEGVQPSRRVPRKHESKSLSEVLSMLA